MRPLAKRRPRRLRAEQRDALGQPERGDLRFERSRGRRRRRP